MANFSVSNYESPETNVRLKWDKPSESWNKLVQELYLSIKKNEYSKFFFQTDVQMIRLLCEHHTKALLNPDTSAAEMKAVYEQWDKFGITMRSRANIRYTQVKTQETENYSADLPNILRDAFGPESGDN